MNCRFQDGRVQTFHLNGWKPPPSPSSPCSSSFSSLFPPRFFPLLESQLSFFQVPTVGQACTST